MERSEAAENNLFPGLFVTVYIIVILHRKAMFYLSFKSTNQPFTICISQLKLFWHDIKNTLSLLVEIRNITSWKRPYSNWTTLSQHMEIRVRTYAWLHSLFVGIMGIVILLPSHFTNVEQQSARENLLKAKVTQEGKWRAHQCGRATLRKMYVWTKADTDYLSLTVWL